MEWGLTKQLQFFRVMRRSVDFRMQEKQLLDNILGPKVYDRRIRPGGIPGGSGGNITSGKGRLFSENSMSLKKICQITILNLKF